MRRVRHFWDPLKRHANVFFHFPRKEISQKPLVVFGAKILAEVHKPAEAIRALLILHNLFVVLLFVVRVVAVVDVVFFFPADFDATDDLRFVLEDPEPGQDGNELVDPTRLVVAKQGQPDVARE